MQALPVLGLWILFAATHLALSGRGLRPRLVARLGPRGFQALYSVVALAIFVPLVRTYYAHKNVGPYLWYFAQLPGLRALGYVLMVVAFVLVVAGLVQPSPAGMRPGAMAVRGIARVTRHPVLMGFGLWGVAHLVLAPVFLSDLFFFVGFPVFAVVGCDHQDQRKRVALGEPYRAFAAATPFFPFASRRFAKGLLERPVPAAIGVGIVLTFVVRVWWHHWLSGQ
jgi:uncharacterized membrane protein